MNKLPVILPESLLWQQKNYRIKPSALSASGTSDCRWQKHFQSTSGRFRYRRDQKNVDELNAVPGNTIGATTDPATIREADVVIIAVPLR